MGDQQPTDRRTIAQKLGYLIETLHPKGRGPYSYQEIAELIRQRAGDGDPTVSHGTIHNIAIGKVTNPSVDSLRALGDFFSDRPAPVSTNIADQPRRQTNRNSPTRRA
ncbi:hypothetical protein [Streptomyces rimosus]|uniref:hypothetical protein n=1 Tax=Streptomyces rimosus TaxID=1927 RepID=UPI0018FE9272|nr:hypothetical protein [Streptomyces rimosus]